MIDTRCLICQHYQQSRLWLSDAFGTRGQLPDDPVCRACPIKTTMLEEVGAVTLKGLTQPVVAYNVPLYNHPTALRVIEGGNRNDADALGLRGVRANDR